MVNSQSESLLREAFCIMSLRGAEGDEAISKIRRGGRKMPGPGMS